MLLLPVFEFPHFLNYTKTVLLWQVPNVLPKSSCMEGAGA